MNKLKFIIQINFLILLLFACSKPEYKFDIDNLNNNKISVFGHGGMCKVPWEIYPMNSLESIQKCLSLGTDGTEVDLQMTKDSVLVIFHDEFLSETTNSEGKVSSLIWNDMKKIKYKTIIPFLYYPIISLEDLILNIPDFKNYIFTLDCKLHPNGDENKYKETFARKINEIISKYNIGENIFIESDDVDFLKLLQKKEIQLNLFLYSTSFDYGLKKAKEMKLLGISMPHGSITKEQVKIAHDNNIKVTLWGVRPEKVLIKSANKSPDFIQVDNVRVALKVLR